MNVKAVVNKEPLKFKWSHHSRIHVAIVKMVNRVARMVPWSVKYSVLPRLKRRSYPYCLLKSGDTVVQIGAPLDTMETGRSRAILFAHFVGDTGKVVVVEPDSASAIKIAELNRKGRYSQIVLEKMGAWTEETVLDFYIDEEHPATNFTGEARNYDSAVMEKYTHVHIPVDSLDNILSRRNRSGPIKLISITTNGAEENILTGMEETFKTRDIEFICLARTGDGYHELMATYGYDLHAYDDRGYCYRKRVDSC